MRLLSGRTGEARMILYLIFLFVLLDMAVWAAVGAKA